MLPRKEVERICREARVPRGNYSFRDLATDLISNEEVRRALRILMSKYGNLKSVSEALGVSRAALTRRLHVYASHSLPFPLRKTWVDVLIVHKARALNRHPENTKPEKRTNNKRETYIRRARQATPREERCCRC
ncbi:MAG: hypothetical protein OEW84_05860 [Aigarchaeota archaeon]|nr:hypothetical protein [Aigarchaeota archaeon]